MSPLFYNLYGEEESDNDCEFGSWTCHEPPDDPFHPFPDPFSPFPYTAPVFPVPPNYQPPPNPLPPDLRPHVVPSPETTKSFKINIDKGKKAFINRNLHNRIDIIKPPLSCPGNPLTYMEIASSGASGKRGGTWGYTRSDGTKFHDGIDLKTEPNPPRICNV